MTQRSRFAAVAAAILAATTAAAAEPWLWTQQQAPRKAGASSMSRALEVIADWPNAARDLAGSLIDEYGAPDVVESARLTWNARPPWRRTIVYRDAAPARGGSGALERVVAYAVPPWRRREVEEFGHGVEYDAADRELRARGADQAEVVLALNLADDVARGRREPAEASAFYERTLSLRSSGKDSAYADKLRFRPD